MSELKPCPFCGGQPREGDVTGLYYVACNGCVATGPIELTIGEAISAWNRRHPNE